MQEVTLYARGSCKSYEENKPGSWETLTVIEDVETFQSGAGLNTTVNRIILQGLIETIKALEAPSNIKIITYTLLGVKKAEKGKGVNKDLLQQLFDLVDAGGHQVSFHTDPDKMKTLVWIPNSLDVITESNPENKKTVSLYVKGSCQYMTEERCGAWVALLCFKGREKVICGERNNATDKRMLITGITEAVKCLKEPCHVKVFTSGNFGLQNFHKGKGVNKDIIKQLFEILIARNHSVEFIINNDRELDLVRALKMCKQNKHQC